MKGGGTMYHETIGVIGWNTRLTMRGFKDLVENNQDIKIVTWLPSQGKARAIGVDGTKYMTISPTIYDRRRLCGLRLDQVILYDDERKKIYQEHQELIHWIKKESMTHQIPEEYEFLFFEDK